MKRIRSLLRERCGYILVEALIAMVAVGTAVYLVVHTDIMPGLKARWDAQSVIIQKGWIQ